MHAIAKKLVYPTADLIFGKYGEITSSSYDMKQTIVLASSSRGGSTWLAEMIGSLPGRPIIWEPLHPGNNPDCRSYGFGWQNYLEEGQSDVQKEGYLKRLFTGRELSTRTLTLPQLKLASFFPLHGYLVKFVNANMLLPWLTEIFPLRTILMIRHPCAVVSSQLRHGGWSSLSKENMTVPHALLSSMPELKELYNRINRLEELLAFEWVLQTVVPIRSHARRWKLTTYEAMVVDGGSELDRIFDFLGETIPNGLSEKMNLASSSTVSDSNVKTGKNPLTGWKEKLTRTQIDRILSVVHQAELYFYTKDLEPDYSQLELD